MSGDYSFIRRRKAWLLAVLCVFLLGLGGFLAESSLAWGSPPTPPPTTGRPGAAPNEAAGKKVYAERCIFCHGEKGDGNGPVARYLNPRPRDFTSGLFKLRSTSTGEPPLDSDLVLTVKKGIPGTAMPSWEDTLNDEEIQNVLTYIKTFAPDRFDPKVSPEIVKIGEPPPITAQLIARGKDVYEKAECWKCHGRVGRADGESAPTLEDDWGFSIRPLNLTKGWRYKRGNTIKDIYTRFSTGMDGTPMPSFLFDLSDEERWALAAYVTTQLRPDPDLSQVILRSRRLAGELPAEPDDPRWGQAKALDIPLTGQVVARPRWQNISVDLLTVRSVYNGREVAFLLEWDDPFPDKAHRGAKEADRGLQGTYVNLEDYGRKLHSYRDALAIQFPKRVPEGARKPHFLWGRANEPVNLWMWRADRQEANPTQAVEQMAARGHLVRKKPAEEGDSALSLLMDELVSPFPPQSQRVSGNGTWKDGTWRIVMKRTLGPSDPQDTLLEVGKLIPIAFQVWDGSNGERGLMMSISSWHFLLLDTPTPVKVYLYTVLAMVAAAALELWLVRRLRQQGP